MPIYEYRCKKCKHELEALQKMTDDKLTECPGCKDSSLERLISKNTSRLNFVGSGFYANDYQNSSNSGGTYKNKTVAVNGNR